MTVRETLPDTAVSVAFCTMNRERDLRSAVASVLSDAETASKDVAIEIIVVDDGDLANEVAHYATECAGRGIPFRYHRKTETTRGLYESRRKAVELCRSPIVLFLDDDAEIGGGYIGGVAERFNADPDIVGIGGVDSQSLPKGASPLARRYMAFFALSGAGAGELSPSGLNYSQAFWRGSPEAFNSQFLHGCNMAFKASALSDLPVLPWLTGHAACEDLVLSYWAARHGALVVDPGLPILHHETPGGRGSVAQRLKRKLANQREFARLSQGRVPAVFLWSSFGLFLKDAALAMTGRHGRRGVPAVLNGYLSLLRNRTPQPTRHRDA